MGTYLSITMWLSVINVILILGLMYVYYKNFARVKSGFTIGLLLFALIFLVQNLVGLYFTATMMPYYAEGVEGYALALTAMQTCAFAVMNYVTWK